MKKKWLILAGLAAGLANGLLGAGGGMIVVPALKKLGLDVKHAHATSVSVILPLSVVSAALYMLRGDVNPGDALIYLPFGVAGAAAVVAAGGGGGVCGSCGGVCACVLGVAASQRRAMQAPWIHEFGRTMVCSSVFLRVE